MTAAPHRADSTAPSRSATLPGRAIAALATAALALVAAFVLAPRTRAASGPGDDFGEAGELAGAFREAFVAYWNSGERALSPDLDRIVDHWFRYHLAKAVIAAMALIVLVVLGVLLWKAFLKADGPGAGRRLSLAAAGVLATLLALLSLAAVAANIQGATAPFASLLPMLPTGASDGEVADVLARIRRDLAVVPRAGDQEPPALDVMIGDFARYHVAMAVIAAIVAVGLVVLGVSAWRRFRRTEPADRRARRTLGSFGVLAVLASLFAIVVAVANTSTAVDPRPALLAFFEGGW
ncbi:hypothetical protein [Streptomyces sp. NRRL B-24572]|uniref:hypothetical protein n=1 Tax=Streptomyces sp. NRRL B-24572 TaxID=1962156 RepID=UPI000A371DEE|nr:hypothetical protein [Streptomyces sp. NRRL B-24572]